MKTKARGWGDMTKEERKEEMKRRRDIAKHNQDAKRGWGTSTDERIDGLLQDIGREIVDVSSHIDGLRVELEAFQSKLEHLKDQQRALEQVVRITSPVVSTSTVEEPL